jgi:hypothetical protein
LNALGLARCNQSTAPTMTQPVIELPLGGKAPPSHSSRRSIMAKRKDPIWDLAFEKGEEKNPQTKRYVAKCIFCGQYMDGRISSMYKHALQVCPLIPEPAKTAISSSFGEKEEAKRKTLESEPSTPLQDSTLSSPNMEMAQHPLGSGLPLHMTGTASSPLYSSTSLRPPLPFGPSMTPPSFMTGSNSKTNKLALGSLNQAMATENLTRFLISCDIPLHEIENQWLLQSLRCLNPTYVPPNQFAIVDTWIPKVHKSCADEIRLRVRDQFGLTLAMEGWKRTNGDMVFLILVYTPHGAAHVLGVNELLAENHTLDDVVSIVEDTIHRMNFNMKMFTWLSTGNCTLLQNARQALQEK